MFLLVDKYEPEGPLAHILKFLVLFCDHAQTAAIRAWAVLAAVSADASPVSHGPAPHHLREQERRDDHLGALNRRHSSTEAGVLRHCSLQIVLHERLTDKWKAATIALSSGQYDYLQTFACLRRVFRQRVY
jgi:hypothetical protein